MWKIIHFISQLCHIQTEDGKVFYYLLKVLSSMGGNI